MVYTYTDYSIVGVKVEMASLSLGVGGPGGAIGVRGGAELEPAVPKGRLSKLWYLVRMIYNNNFTRLKHTTCTCTTSMLPLFV